MESAGGKGLAPPFFRVEGWEGPVFIYAVFLLAFAAAEGASRSPAPRPLPLGAWMVSFMKPRAGAWSLHRLPDAGHAQATPGGNYRRERQTEVSGPGRY